MCNGSNLGIGFAQNICWVRMVEKVLHKCIVDIFGIW